MHTHKKIIAVGIICLAAIVSTLIYSKQNQIFGKSTSFQSITTSNTSATTKNNIPFWPKATGSTTIIVDPAVLASVKAISGPDTSDDTLTGQVSKQLFSQFLAAQQNGTTIDDPTALAMANATVATIPPSSGKQYTVKDILIIPDSNAQAFNIYRKQMIDAMGNLPTNTPSPLDIINNAVQQGTESSTAQMTLWINGYTKMIAATLKISVPSAAVGYHMVYLNTLSNLLDDITGMRDLINDPLKGYIAFSNYQYDSQKLIIVLNTMSTEFSKIK